MSLMTKVLVDTNLLIYALDSGSSYYSKSMSILANPQYQLYITSKNITEYFAVSSKLRIPPKQVWNFYKEVKQNVIILYPNDESILRLERMIKKYQPKGNAIFDLEVVATALTAGVKNIATVNLKDFQQIKGIRLL